MLTWRFNSYQVYTSYSWPMCLPELPVVSPRLPLLTCCKAHQSRRRGKSPGTALSLSSDAWARWSGPYVGEVMFCQPNTSAMPEPVVCPRIHGVAGTVHSVFRIPIASRLVVLVEHAGLPPHGLESIRHTARRQQRQGVAELMPSSPVTHHSRRPNRSARLLGIK